MSLDFTHTSFKQFDLENTIARTKELIDFTRENKTLTVEDYDSSCLDFATKFLKNSSVPVLNDESLVYYTLNKIKLDYYKQKKWTYSCFRVALENKLLTQNDVTSKIESSEIQTISSLIEDTDKLLLLLDEADNKQVTYEELEEVKALDEKITNSKHDFLAFIIIWFSKIERDNWSHQRLKSFKSILIFLLKRKIIPRQLKDKRILYRQLVSKVYKNQTDESDSSFKNRFYMKPFLNQNYNHFSYEYTNSQINRTTPTT